MESQILSEQTNTPLTPRVRAALDGWNADLLDLTKANRLLYFKPLSHGLALINPDGEECFAALVNADRAYTIYRPDRQNASSAVKEQLELVLTEESLSETEDSNTSARDALPAARSPRADEIVLVGEPKKIETTLYRYRLKSRSALQEQGTNVLFIAFGTLEWSEIGFSEVRILSPLLLVPVRLDRETSLAPYRVTPIDEGVVLNPSLVRKLRRDFSLALTLPDEEESDLALPAALDHLRAQIAEQHDWCIRPEVFLGLFSFAKYAMYADLEASRERIGNHPVVRLISGEDAGLPEPIADLPSAERLDITVKPSSVYQVLDADASQQEAIAAVKAGANLVIQGPPGTGKSQTITNIIAESLAAGKTVLFVSEKIAALKVVAKRLAEAGLGEFCLEAHGQDANKAVIIKELERTLRADRRRSPDASALDLERLATLRTYLNAFVHALHDADNPLSTSAFRAHGEIASRDGVPIISFDFPDIATLTPQGLAQLTDTIRRLVQVGEVLLTETSHPWHGCTLGMFTPQIQIELRGWMQRLNVAATDLANAEVQLYALWGLSYAHSLEAAIWLRSLLMVVDEIAAWGITPHDLMAEWFEPSRHAALAALAAEAGNQHEAVQLGRTTLLARFQGEIFGAATEELTARFEGTYTVWTRVFNAAYRRESRYLRSFQRIQGALRYHDALNALHTARAVVSAEAWITTHHGELAAAFGSLFAGFETDWRRISNALERVGRILNLFGGAPPATFTRALLAGTVSPASVRIRLDADITEVGTVIETLRSSFDPTTYLIAGLSPERAELVDVAIWAYQKSGALSQLEDWIDYRHARAEMEALGLGAFIDGLIRIKPKPPHPTWEEAFLRQVYTLWLTWRYGQSPELSRFRGQSHEETIAEFRRLDEQQLRAASRRIAGILIAKRPPMTANMPPRSEPMLLVREATKKRRFRPLRQLFADLPNVLPALKPCMLMSPLSVAQFLGESATRFDVVIFDEASQILPADAIGAISRGDQVIVVGDNKQLPPTNFWGKAVQNTIDDDDDEYADAPESILDSCIASGMTQKRLLWHYRSRHEDLIAFSNRHFYENDLVTFPSPNAGERAVEFVYVADGVYDRGGKKWNRIEARRVVELIVEHVRHHPRQSLGVIAFSEAQMTAIQAELDFRKHADPTLESLLREDGPEGFFIKNLETVQGDERDVIFFSVGFGFDNAGKFEMNFGPLNRDGGERRLNVAVTRARDHVKVIASIRPHDIDRTRSKARGVHLLRAYLEFAERGPTALLGEITAEGGEPESPFEESVLIALGSLGLDVKPQIGVSGFRIDIGIKDEATDRYLLGVECDGATYHSSKTARDRDRLRQQVLENLGWRIHRIWSTDWIKDPEREIRKVLAALQEARTQVVRDLPLEDPEQTLSQPMMSNDAGTIAVASARFDEGASTPGASLRIAQPYVAAVLPWQGGKEVFDRKSPVDLMPLVEQCVRIEGPVHQDRVMRAIATSFGLGRVGSNIRAKILAAIDLTVKGRVIERWESFLTLYEMSDVIVRENGGRTIQEIYPDEIVECIVAFLKIAYSISRDDLVTAVAREFGYDRTGNHVAAGIRPVIEWMIAEGAVVDTGGQIRLKA